MGPLGSCPLLHSVAGTQQSPDSQPNLKRRRLDSGGTSLPSVPGEQTSYCSDIRKLFADVYCHLGAALASNHNHKDALHFLRLSLQLNQGKTYYLHSINLILLEFKVRPFNTLYLGLFYLLKEVIPQSLTLL